MTRRSFGAFSDRWIPNDKTFVMTPGVTPVTGQQQGDYGRRIAVPRFPFSVYVKLEFPRVPNVKLRFPLSVFEPPPCVTGLTTDFPLRDKDYTVSSPTPPKCATIILP